MLYSLAQKLLFQLDAEASHDITMSMLKKTQRTPLQSLYAQSIVPQPVELWGLTFENPVGLAAGLDKNGECIDAFAAMGFGFIEIGTVTPKPQDGNPKPRLFRLKDSNAIINRMGFNNKGVDYLVEQVKKCTYKGVLGINIGKNKDTSEENALDDYLICLRKVYPYASYVTINISSPNTPGLRNLQYGEALISLLTGLKKEQGELQKEYGKYVPLVVKIAPDLTEEEVEQIADALISSNIDGVIATNTTLARDKVEGQRYAKEAGGLSGEPLTQQSQWVMEKLNPLLKGKIPVIAVGGLSSRQDFKTRMDAGAQLVQVYTGFIYQGPQLIRRMLEKA